MKIVRSLVWLTLGLLVITPAQSQVFNSSPLPGIGAVDIQIGFAPPLPFIEGSEDPCKPRATFPGNTISIPFSTYIVMRRKNYDNAIRFNHELKIMTPSGREWSYPGTQNLKVNQHQWCSAFLTDNANELGVYRYRYIINGYEVGRLSVTVRSP